MREITDRAFTDFEALMKMVSEENIRQIEKRNIQACTPEEWIMYLGEEYGELCKAISDHESLRGSAGDVIKEAIQTATLALKIAEMYLM